MPTKIATEKAKTEKPEKGKMRVGKMPAGKYSVYSVTKRIKKVKKRVWFAIAAGLIVLFFIFGFTARFIFGKNSPITKVAEEGIADVINIVRGIEKAVPVILHSLSVFFIGLAIIWLLLTIIRAIGSGSNRRKTVCSLIASFVKYIGAIIIFTVLLGIWFGSGAVTTVVAGLGILGLVIGLGAQSMISDILAGVFIVFENNFCVGDIVTVDDFRGTVTEIGVRTTQIKSPLGDLKIINNSHIRILINMSRHSSFAICEVTISYTEDLERVEKIITANLERIGKKLPAVIETPGYLGAAEFTNRGVLLKIKARCVEADRIQLTRDLNKEIKLLFDKNKIKIAVEQVEVKAPRK